MNIEKSYSKECQILKKKLSHYRYIHSLSVAREVSNISTFFKLDLKDIQLAALFHDLAREVEIGELIKFSKTDLCPDYPEEYNEVPILLHAPVSIQFLRQNNIFLLEKYERAIIYHPVGDPELFVSSLVLMISDLIEEERKFPSLKKLRSLVYSSQDIFEAAYIVIEEKINFSKSAGNKILNCTLQTFEKLDSILKNIYQDS